jgi:hypothetical protein
VFSKRQCGEITINKRTERENRKTEGKKGAAKGQKLSSSVYLYYMTGRIVHRLSTTISVSSTLRVLCRTNLHPSLSPSPSLPLSLFSSNYVVCVLVPVQSTNIDQKAVRFYSHIAWMHAKESRGWTAVVVVVDQTTREKGDMQRGDKSLVSCLASCLITLHSLRFP